MNQKIVLEPNNYITQEVGMLRSEVPDLLDIIVKERRIILYPGVIKHMKARHFRAYQQYFKKIPDIVQNPDYIGLSPSVEKCIELVKKYEQYVLVAIKWNEQGQLFVSSMYMMDDERIENRVMYGKLIAMPKLLVKKGQKYKNSRRLRR